MSSATMRNRWRSRQHVGVARPRQVVQIQRGRLHRTYHPFVMLDGDSPDFGIIANGKHNHEPWHADWEPQGPWMTVPGVLTVQADDNLDLATGMAEPTAVTINIENVVAVERAGVAGIFHSIERGYLAPMRGFQSFGRPEDPDATQNEWFDTMNGGVKVRVEQGYGNELEPTFVGLIDDCDTRSSPDQITLTCRSFGAVLTDQRAVGWNKARDIRSPIIFADRKKSTKEEKKGGAALASSFSNGYPPKGVTEAGEDTSWLSFGHTTPENTEWVEVHLPKGSYENFLVNPMYDGMEMYVGVFARNKNIDRPCRVNGVEVPNGWVDLGLGDVPGSYGGWPYTRKWNSVDSGADRRKLGFKLECGDNTVLRVAFRNLALSPGKGDYRARVARLAGIKETVKKDAKIHKWILVDDAADVVKWVFMWCGFKEWNVKKLGVPLKDPIAFHQGDYMVDIVRHMVEQANYVYYVAKPSDDPDSLGVPHFVPNGAIQAVRPDLEEVTDQDLLTGIETKFSKEPLSYITRTRGKIASKKKGGTKLFEDTTRRITAVYRPPWSGVHRNIITNELDVDYPFAGRLAGVRKHRVHDDPGITSENEAQMMNLLMSVQEALQSFQGTITVPGYPAFQGVNNQVSVVDTPSGTNSRLWVAHASSTFTSGEQTSWVMSLQGAFVDTPDILLLAFDYFGLLQKVLAEYAE